MATDSLLYCVLLQATGQYRSLGAGLVHNSAAKLPFAPTIPARCSKPPVQFSILHILVASPASQAAPPPGCSQKEQLSRNQSRVLLCERPFKGAVHSSQQETIAHLLLRLWPLQGHSVSSSFPNTLYWFLLRAIMPL